MRLEVYNRRTSNICVKSWPCSTLQMTVTQVAAGLDVSRKTLSLLVNGHAGISPEMAVRLSKAFGRTPESWLQLQMQYDLAQIRQRTDDISVTSFAPNEAALASAGA